MVKYAYLIPPERASDLSDGFTLLLEILEALEIDELPPPRVVDSAELPIFLIRAIVARSRQNCAARSWPPVWTIRMGRSGSKALAVAQRRHDETSNP